MQTLQSFGSRTFASLSVRNYRLYFAGQAVSQVGDWMQTVALSWLVFTLTDSGVAIGTLLAMRFAPLLFGAPVGGIIADKFPKRKILFVTQSLFGVVALVLGILTVTGVVQYWMTIVCALLMGLIDAADRPSRQTFVHELVGRDHLRNAVTLNSTINNLCRGIGPMIGGTLIAVIGIAPCFFLNGISYLAVLYMLKRIRKEEFHYEEMVEVGKPRLSESIRYAASVPTIRNVLLSMAIVGTLSYEFQVSLPLFSELTFASGAAGYAALLSMMGFGSVAGGLFSASREKLSASGFVLSATLFGACALVTAMMPTLALAVTGMFFVGFFSISLSSSGNTMLQLESAPHMRGRVMALWSMAIFGSTFIGGPTVGFVAQQFGGRAGILLAGFAALIAALYAALTMLERDRLFFIPSFIKISSEEETGTEGTKV